MLKKLEAPDEIYEFESTEKLASICRMLAPSIDVDLYVQDEEQFKEKLIESDDWKDINSINFIIRLLGFRLDNCPDDIKSIAEESSPLLKPIFNDNGEQVGRAGISLLEEYSYSSKIRGCLTNGGLFVTSLQGVFGIFVGEVIGASRKRGNPIASEKAIANWATEQGQEILNNFKYLSPNSMNNIAGIINSLDGDATKFPLCYTHYGWLNYYQIKEYDWPDRLGFTSIYTVQKLTNLKSLASQIFATNHSISFVFQDWQMHRFNKYNTIHYVVLRALTEMKKINTEEFVNYYYENKTNYNSMNLGTTLEGAIIENKVEIIDFT